MDRLVETSKGPILVDLDRSMPLATRRGFSLTVRTYDAHGWEATRKAWGDRYGHHERDETLAEFLVAAVGLPMDEAETLAAQIAGPWLDEWERRGGGAEAKQVARFAATVVAAVIALAALGVLGLILLVWMLVT